jgi:glycosyltransferase involved in cell wall biosynthesis
MVHFFPIFSRNAGTTEFGHALRRIGVEHRIFSDSLNLRYKNRLVLLFVHIPRLMWFAGKMGIASLALCRPIPDVVVLGSDIEVLIFALLRTLTGRRRVRIVLGSFIFTSRRSGWQNRLRHFYYRFVLSHVDMAIVHSRMEVDQNTKIFPGLHTQFRYVPWGTNIDSRQQLLGDARFAPGGENVIVTAGRSERDYGTLFRAMDGVDAGLRVICDYLKEKPSEALSARITLLSDCYGDAYLRELVDATLVVVPVAAGQISAGQMVLIQSMGLGKAIIVTDTPTIRDYVTDRHDAWLVPMGDAAAMQGAILHLLQNPQECERLGRNARDTFDAKLSAEGHLRGLVNAINETD